MNKGIISDGKLAELGFDLKVLERKMQTLSEQRRIIRDTLLELGINPILANNVGIIETVRAHLNVTSYETLLIDRITQYLKLKENGFILGNTSFLIDANGSLIVEENQVGVEGKALIKDVFDRTGKQLTHQEKGAIKSNYSIRTIPLNKDGQVMAGLIARDYRDPIDGLINRKIYLDYGSPVFYPRTHINACSTELKPSNIIKTFLLHDATSYHPDIESVIDKSLGYSEITIRDLSQSFPKHSLDYNKTIQKGLAAFKKGFWQNRELFVKSRKGSYLDFDKLFLAALTNNLDKRYPTGVHISPLESLSNSRAKEERAIHILDDR